MLTVLNLANSVMVCKVRRLLRYKISAYLRTTPFLIYDNPQKCHMAYILQLEIMETTFKLMHNVSVFDPKSACHRTFWDAYSGYYC